MSLIKCPNCGHDVSDKAIKCPNCGCSMKKNNPAQNDSIRCPKCGAMMDKDSAICPNCGNPIQRQYPHINQQPYGPQRPPTNQSLNTNNDEQKDNSNPLQFAILGAIFLIIIGLAAFIGGGNKTAQAPVKDSDSVAVVDTTVNADSASFAPSTYSGDTIGCDSTSTY